MAEAGVDISKHHSKAFSELKERGFDLVVTVCDKARESCPVYLGHASRLHRSFDDPPFLAKGATDEEDALSHYRRVRDEIRTFVASLPDILERMRHMTARD